MIFTMLGHVNGRTIDGRTFSAMEGNTSVVADDDVNMVAMVKDWAARGLVKIHAPAEVKKAVVVPDDHDDVKAPTRRGHPKEDK